MHLASNKHSKYSKYYNIDIKSKIIQQSHFIIKDTKSIKMNHTTLTNTINLILPSIPLDLFAIVGRKNQIPFYMPSTASTSQTKYCAIPDHGHNVCLKNDSISLVPNTPYNCTPCNIPPMTLQPKRTLENMLCTRSWQCHASPKEFIPSLLNLMRKITSDQYM